jgi:hypothetical protein
LSTFGALERAGRQGVTDAVGANKFFNAKSRATLVDGLGFVLLILGERGSEILYFRDHQRRSDFDEMSFADAINV